MQCTRVPLSRYHDTGGGADVLLRDPALWPGARTRPVDAEFGRHFAHEGVARGFPFAGSCILRFEGEVVPVGTVLVVIGGDGSTPQPEKSSTKPAARAEEKVRATPLVRKVAAELGVDLAGLSGTGAQGRITEEDVRAASGAEITEGERIQLHGIRRQMFEHLTRAHREIPAVTWVEECDFSEVDLKRLVPLVLRAVAESLREFPELNARVEGGELVLLDRYDIGVAVQTEQGSSSRSCTAPTGSRSTSSTPR